MLCNMEHFFRDIFQQHIRRNHEGDLKKGSDFSRSDDKKGSGRPSCGHGQGYHAMYLGKVPIPHSSGETHVSERVDKLLDICNMNETYIDEVFLDIKPFALIMHFVDITSKVIDTKLFDLARISYCSAGNLEDSRILAWIYRQETEEGFQLECHAVRCNTIRKTKTIVYQLHESITRLYVDMQAALKSCESFRTASRQNNDTDLRSVTNGETHKTVRFNDNVETIDFDVKDDDFDDDSSSIGDNSVFFSDDSEKQPCGMDTEEDNIDDLQICLGRPFEAREPAGVNSEQLQRTALQSIINQGQEEAKHLPVVQKTHSEGKKSTFFCTEYLKSPPVPTAADITVTCVDERLAVNSRCAFDLNTHSKQADCPQNLRESTSHIRDHIAHCSLAGEVCLKEDLEKCNQIEPDLGHETLFSNMNMDDVSEYMEKHDFFASHDAQDTAQDNFNVPGEEDEFLTLHTTDLFQDSDSGGEDSASTLVEDEGDSFGYKNNCFQDIAL